MLAGMLVFGVFCAALGANPLLVYASMYKAGFGSWYSWQNTLVRASPLCSADFAPLSPRAPDSS